MSDRLPSPSQLFLRLVGVGAAVASLQALVLLPLRPASVVLALPTFAIAVLLAAFVVVRTASLYRSARRAAEGGEAPPPSRAVLGDALLAPERAALALVALEAAAAIVALLGYRGELPPAFFVTPIIASVLVVAPALAFGYRRALVPWLAAFPPSEIAPIASQPLHRRIALAAGGGAFGIGLLGTGIAARAFETQIAALTLGSAVTLGVVVIVALIAMRLSRRLGVDLARLKRAVVESADGGHSFDVEALRREGEQPLVAELAEAITGASTSIRRIADDEERTTSSIQESQQKKTVFMASMSHDLRSPLNSIMGFSELLLSGIGGDLTEGQRESVNVIQRSGSELLELLNDIIDSARLDASRLLLRREWTPMVELLTEAITKGREIVQLRTGTGTGFTIVEELEPGLPPVYVDHRRIVQAILCIFRHATMVMEGGAIRLSAKTVGGDVRVSITDTGTAFIDEDRERVFQAFRSITSVSGRRIGGMGLSLSLARSLVRAHGGDIRYDPRAEGTTFHLTIPATTDGGSDAEAGGSTYP